MRYVRFSFGVLKEGFGTMSSKKQHTKHWKLRNSLQKCGTFQKEKIVVIYLDHKFDYRSNSKQFLFFKLIMFTHVLVHVNLKTWWMNNNRRIHEKNHLYWTKHASLIEDTQNTCKPMILTSYLFSSRLRIRFWSTKALTSGCLSSSSCSSSLELPCNITMGEIWRKIVSEKENGNNKICVFSQEKDSCVSPKDKVC